MHRAHRERLLRLLQREGAAAIIPSGAPKIRNHDCEHRFRPESDFYYLSGFAEPSAVLVLRPRHEGERALLFLRERVREEELWTGRRLGVEAAPGALGVDAAYPIADLWSKLPALLVGYERVLYGLGADEERDRNTIAAVARAQAQARTGAVVPRHWIAPAELLHELRVTKSDEEIATLRRAAAITAEAHALVMREAQPGRNEAELDALLEFTFRRRGSTGAAYTSIVAGGANACVLHYVDNCSELRAGELVLVDAGAESQYYASDVTRTFPVDGRFRPAQRALYEVVLAAQEAAIERVRPGVRFDDVHRRAVEVLTRGLVDLGLLAGPVESAVANETYKRFYMHRTGHWLGLDVHDCGAYHCGGESRRLEPGMVTTVEPGLYVAPDDDSVDARWRGIGIRIEDDLLVTRDGHEVLTAAIPKAVDDVEAACAGAELALRAPR